MKIIVTGANGFIGSTLIRKLTENNNEIFAIDISFEIDNLGDNSLVHKIETSLDNISQYLNELPENADVFYHLAWQGVNGPEKANPIIQNHNIEMALNCAKIAKIIGCKKFLCAGTIAERAVDSLQYLNKTSGGMMYGVSKYCAHIMLETYCKNVEMDFIWMQFSNIYGPKNKTGNLVSYTLSEILQGREATFGPANQPYDFIYIDDLIEAVFRLGTKKTHCSFYYIGSGTPRILKDYLLLIGELCQKRDLIKIGLRPDDGIKYSFDMFNIDNIVNDIGHYVSDTFEHQIRFTINNY